MPEKIDQKVIYDYKKDITDILAEPQLQIYCIEIGGILFLNLR